MKPLNLTITAFGPFRDQQFIDFSLLGDAPLFLINGVTGAGKTTILDAICYALYGKTTGDDREAPQMRSDGADDGLLTSVEFSFALKGAFYRIKRLPEQQRLKAKGDGFTKQGAEAQLWEIDPEGNELKIIVSQKVTDATKEIEQLTGLNADQFRQVMVLPQGQFRKLLVADSKDREAIFSRLFSTSIYKRIENQLKDKALVLSRKVSDLSRLKEGVLHSLNLTTQTDLENAIERLRDNESSAKRIKNALENKTKHANKLLEQAIGVKKSFDQLAILEQKKEELTQQRNHIVAVKQRLLRAEEAQKITPVYDDYQSVAIKIPLAQTELNQSLANVDSSLNELNRCEEAQKQSPTLRQQLDTAKAELIDFKRYSNKAVELSQLQSQYESSNAQRAKFSENVDTTAKQIALLVTEKQSVNEKIHIAKQQIEQLDDPKIRVVTAEQKIQQLTEIETLRQQQQLHQQQLQGFKDTGAQVRKSSDDANEAVNRLELQWHLSQAQILAEQLKDHQPCPVCGSKEHPAKATSHYKAVTRAQIDQAKKDALAWEKKLQIERENYTHCHAQYKALKAQVEQSVIQFEKEALSDTEIDSASDNGLAVKDVLFWKGRYEEAKQKVRLLGDQKVHLQQAEKRLKQLESLQIEATELHLQQQKILNEADKDIAVIDSELKACMKALPSAYQTAGALEKAIEKNTLVQTETEKKLEKLANDFLFAQGNHKAAIATSDSQFKVLTELQEQLASLNEAWLKAVKSSFFNEEIDYLQAVVSLEEQQHFRDEINRYELKRKELEGAIKTQQGMINEQKLPDIESLTQETTLMMEQLEAADNEWLAISKQLSQFVHSAKQIDDISMQNQALEKEYAVVGTLSDVANGQTADKVSLQRFVLSALLDDVLVEASSRLQIMSKGRYQLLRKEQRAKGNKASGLELEVEDAYTGKIRSVATLSGGESFMAALSLALGLSGVVQAHAGGIVLDTLFIDEGFGSLDSEALDLAIRTLIDLQSTGRMIGVISHVNELKEQMTTRIDIIASQSGSHIELIH